MAEDRNTKQDDGIDFRPEAGAQPIKKGRQAAATASADGIDFRPEGAVQPTQGTSPEAIQPLIDAYKSEAERSV